MTRLLSIFTMALCALAASGLQAKTLKMANQGDVTSMDPH